MKNKSPLVREQRFSATGGVSLFFVLGALNKEKTMKLSKYEIINELNNNYVPSIENIEDISDLNSFYMNELRENNVDINVDDISQEATALLLLEAVNLSAKEIDSRFYDDKVVIANYIFAHCTNIYWYRDESWGFDCYYFWHPEVGQVSIHDPYEQIEVGKTKLRYKPQKWSKLPRQNLAYEILKDPELRRKVRDRTRLRNFPDLGQKFCPVE